MPPRNPARSTTREDVIAERVREMRETRGWSLDGLAKRMTDAGCAIQPSAIFKTETPDGDGRRRRIVVDELIAYSRVFEVPIDQLISLPGENAATDAESALVDVYRYRAAAEAAEVRIENERVSASLARQRLADAHQRLMESLLQLSTESALIVLNEAGGEWGDELRAEYTKARATQKPPRRRRTSTTKRS